MIQYGYNHLDNLIEINTIEGKSKKNSNQTQILLAPSWGKNGLFDTKIEEIIEILLDSEYKVVLRPHPMSLKLSDKKISSVKKYMDNGNE